jgi:hypothetical protein
MIWLNRQNVAVSFIIQCYSTKVQFSVFIHTPSSTCMLLVTEADQNERCHENLSNSLTEICSILKESRVTVFEEAKYRCKKLFVCFGSVCNRSVTSTICKPIFPKLSSRQPGMLVFKSDACFSTQYVQGVLVLPHTGSTGSNHL